MCANSSPLRIVLDISVPGQENCESCTIQCNKYTEGRRVLTANHLPDSQDNIERGPYQYF